MYRKFLTQDETLALTAIYLFSCMSMKFARDIIISTVLTQYVNVPKISQSVSQLFEGKGLEFSLVVVFFCQIQFVLKTLTNVVPSLQNRRLQCQVTWFSVLHVSSFIYYLSIDPYRITKSTWIRKQSYFQNQEVYSNHMVQHSI